MSDIVLQLKSYSKKLYITIFSLLLIIQIGFISYGLSQTSDTIPIIYSINNDAANGVIVTYRSNWLNDNGFYAYGNLYYRIANTLYTVNPFSEKIPFSENADKSLHFTLMFLSLISLLLICSLISYILFRKFEYMILSISILLNIFFASELWFKFVLVVHPDIFLSFITCLGCFFTFKFISDKNNKAMFYISAITWGLCLATKLFSLFYLPGILIGLIITYKNNTRMISEITKYFLIIIITYFLVGFPQNFQIFNTFNFLIYQSGYSLPPTLNSFIEWIKIISSQIFLPLTTVLLLSSISDKKYPINKNSFLAMLIICIFPYIVLLSRNITSPHQHYTLPIAATIILLISLLRIKRLTIPNNYTIFLLSFMFILSNFLSYSKLKNEVTLEMNCRTEARETYKNILKYQKQGKKIHADPYIAFDFRIGNIITDWFPNIDKTLKSDISILALSTKYYSRYVKGIEPSEYTKHDAPTWRDQREFYNLFYNKNVTIDPIGNKWKKIYSNECETELWEKN